MKRAVVVHLNWETEEIMHTLFEGDSAADDAAGWAHPDSFIWRDFPAENGWVHFVYWTKEAGDARGARIRQDLEDGKWITDRVPK